MAKSERFDGQVVIITGASAGIGAEVARKMASEGAAVVLAARGREALERTAVEIGRLGGRALVVPTDVGDLSACDALVDAAIERFGALHGLVNNAALHHRGPFVDNDAKGLANMVHVNLSSPVYLSRIALPHLLGTRGFIVNVASIAGCVPTPGSAVYSATKFGLRALSKALAQEVADTGVRVSVVSPGPVDTGFIMDDLEHVTDLTLSQPISTAAEVADAVLACAVDGLAERKLPSRSGALATVAYLAPGLAKRLRPALERKGRRTRDRLRKSEQ